MTPCAAPSALLLPPEEAEARSRMGTLCDAAAWKADTLRALESHLQHVPGIERSGKRLVVSRRSARPASQFSLPPVRNRTFPRPTGAGAFYSDLTLGGAWLYLASRLTFNAIQFGGTSHGRA